MIGNLGRVSGTVGPGRVGEVILSIRGGTEAFNAYSFDGETYLVGTVVLVMDFQEPRSVYVVASPV